jgi:uncharacterized caspase-like protein
MKTSKKIVIITGAIALLLGAAVFLMFLKDKKDSAAEKPESLAAPEVPAEPAAAAFSVSEDASSAITALAFSEDGAYLLAASADGYARIWKLAAGEQVTDVKAGLDAAAEAAGIALWKGGGGDPAEGTTASALDKGGTRLAYGYADGAVVLKEAGIGRESGRESGREIASEDGEWISITPKGYFNASAKGGELVSVQAWDETYTMNRLSERFHRPDLYADAVEGKETAGPSLEDITGSPEYRPPLVELVSPAKMKVSEDHAGVAVRITERSGGAGRLVVYNNGTPVGTPAIDEQNPKRSESGGNTVYEFTLDVAVDPGMNVIGVAAFDRQQTIESEAGKAEIEAEYRLAAGRGKPALYVLAVAIAEYEGNGLYGNLSYTVNDADAVGELFKRQKAGNLYSDVIVKRLTGKEVTRAGFMKAFNDLRKEVTADDTFVLFYAGHGDVDGRKDFFLVPYDTPAGRVITKEDIIDSIAKIRAKQTLVLLDTCRSGALIDMETAFGRLLEKMGRKAVLVAASGDQSAVETARAGEGHGVFTNTLLEYAGSRAESGRYDKVGTVIKYVRETVPEQVRKMQESGRLEGQESGTRGAKRRDVILQEPLAKLPAEDYELFDRYLDPGEVEVSAASEGSVVIEGAPGGTERLAAGGTLRRKLAEKKYRVTILYSDGKKEERTVEVENNGRYEVKFEYKAPKAVVPVPVPASTMVPAAPPEKPATGRMVKVPAGTWTRGGSQITISKAFNLGKYEVTQKEWVEVMGSNPSYFNGDSLPVEHVSWYDVVEYCNKRSVKEGLTPAYTVSGTNVTWNRNANGYRLPTEAEWEYAARSGGKDTYEYAGGNDAGDVAWYSDNSGSKTHPVGTKAANSLGIMT